MSKSIEEIHRQTVAALIKPGVEIQKSVSAHDLALVHAVMGISGEAGELLDAVKKAVIYQKPLDIDNVIEELGDIEFYMEELRRQICITRETTLSRNIMKLRKRYPDGEYSDEDAQARADKQED